MPESKPTFLRSRLGLRHYALAGTVAWTALIVASLIWSMVEERRDILDEARYEAQISFQKELLLQFWLGGHYEAMRAKNNAPADRDAARSAENTALYPAPMLRQMLGSQSPGLRSHLASLKPTWPENTADTWEAAAIRAFAKGEPEVASVETIEGQEFMRVMRPLVTEASCQTCHGTTDFRIGEIRGGLSVAVPLAPLVVRSQRSRIALFIADGIIWVLGLGAISFGARRMKVINLERSRTLAVLRDNEKRYHTLADSGQALIWTTGLDNKCDYVNETWLKFTGRTLAQVLGDGWVEGVHPDDRARCFESYSTAFDRREAYSAIYRLRRYDGEFRWVQDNGSPRHDSQGNFLGYIGHCLDITERQQAELALQESEERYRTVLENVGEGIAMVNASEEFTFANPAAENIFGVPRGGLLGRSVLEFTSPDQADRVRDQTAKRRAGERNAYEIVITRPGGEQRIVLVTAVPQVDRQGVFAGTFGVFRDITERKHVEAERERVIGELRETLAETKTLSGLLPICSGCKKIRDDQSKWKSVEIYLHEHTGALFTHGICPECVKKYYPGIELP